MKHRLSRALLVRLRVLRGEEHQVDVAVGRHLAPPGAAEANEREGLAERRIHDPFADEVPGEPHQLIMEECGGLRRGPAVPRFLGQAPGDFGAPGGERLGKDRGGIGAHRLARLHAL